VKPTLLAAALLLAGCGRAGHAGPAAPAPPPALAKRCGTGYSHARTFWFTASDGTRLDGAELGRGPRGVVLLHESAPADLCGWEPYGARLARAGFHVLLVDLRGAGLSARGRHGGPLGAIADARGAVDELRGRGAKKVVLVGASYGGVNALVAAPALGSRIAAVASLSGELDLGRGSSTELDALAAVKRLRVPLLVLGSRDDRYLSAAEARRLVRAAHSTHATLAEFEGTVHGWDLLSISPERKRADRILQAFLRRATQ
jgi:pimeloyl-ACP methyl ester carboxylesterase